MDPDLYSFDFDPAQVAQHPIEPRERSRLLVLDREADRLLHCRFDQLPGLIRGDEIFVVNDTRVIPARLLGRKASQGRVELLLVRPVAGTQDRWWAMGRANRSLRPGQVLRFEDEEVMVLGTQGPDGLLHVAFREGIDMPSFLERAGKLPLPPYIRREPCPEDWLRYQTIFASSPGAVAAPTAGLHFSKGLIEELRQRGAQVFRLTLHVGPGTFRPITSPSLDQHRMHRESYEIPIETARAVKQARLEGRPVVAVGTTVVRALEAAALDALDQESPAQQAQGLDKHTRPLLRAGPRQTDLFIRPGFRFRVVDSLITNFHWPRSTLIVLVSALAGRERVLAAYQEAVKLGYRLFSYGDAMWIR